MRITLSKGSARRFGHMAEYLQDSLDDTALSQIARDMRDMRDRVIRMETKMEAAAAVEPTVKDHGERLAVLEDREAQANDAPARWGAIAGIALGAAALLERLWGHP